MVKKSILLMAITLAVAAISGTAHAYTATFGDITTYQLNNPACAPKCAPAPCGPPQCAPPQCMPAPCPPPVMKCRPPMPCPTRMSKCAPPSCPPPGCGPMGGPHGAYGGGYPGPVSYQAPAMWR